MECLKVENIMAKGEIACFDQFLLLSLCFQKAVCCRGVRKRLYMWGRVIQIQEAYMMPLQQATF